MKLRSSLRALAAALVASACSIVPATVPADAPPLHDLEEPLALAAEPADEAARVALPAGSFSGLELAEARATLEEMVDGGAAAGVEVLRVVENSPADVGGVEAGDLLVSATIGGRTQALAWASEWRAIELAEAPGTRVALVIDRAAARKDVELVLAPRARAAARVATERWREDARAGVVVRTATEVEARSAGLAPGAGAVVVGLARTSPWRRAGVRFGDLVAAVDGAPVAHPEVLLSAVRAGARPLHLGIVRAGERLELDAPLSQREHELTEFSIPLLYSYENDRGHTTTSALFGLYKFERTRVAWRLRLLWFVSFAGGDADRLEELGS
ncbi:MAG: hypothetical protein IPJ77_17145 [Planctomycetes bacterium]|nr:hypothetical protein [Planctomycetota bacterium]